MDIILILGGGCFIAYVIISMLRVIKFNKSHGQQYQNNVNNTLNEDVQFEFDDIYSDPVYHHYSGNLYHND